MTTRSTAKKKGSQFEYDCQASLEQRYKEVYLTKERGFQRQFDIKIQLCNGFIAIECKRLKGISWNQLQKFYDKLVSKTPKGEDHYILFKSNFQPCLVFDGSKIETFTSVFDVSFIKHKSTRSK